jgi:hypothetical protein
MVKDVFFDLFISVTGFASELSDVPRGDIHGPAPFS